MPTASPYAAAPDGWRVRLLLPAILAALAMIGPFTIDTAFPAFAEMRGDLGASTPAMQLVVSVYMLAFAVMSPFHGPLSDAIGRRPVMLGGVTLFALASVGCALSTSLPMLLTFRALQGLSAGGGVIVSRTIVRDLFDGPRAQQLMSQVGMIFGLGPAIAPVAGGWLLQLGPWRGIFWFLMAYGLLVVALVAIGLPETHPPEKRIAFRAGVMVRELWSVCRSLTFQRIALGLSFSFAAQFLYVGAAAIFLGDLLEQGETDYWKLFFPMISGVVLGSWISKRAAGRLGQNRLVSYGLAFVGLSALLNVALSLVHTSSPVLMAVIGPTLMAIGVAASFPTVQIMLLDLFPHARGAAASMSTFATLVLNASVAALLAPLVAHSLLAMALAALVLSSIGSASWLWHLRVRRAATEDRDRGP